MQLWKDSEYSRIPSMTGFCVCQRCAMFWICLNNALWEGSQKAWSTFYRVLNKPLVLNMLRRRIWQGFEYARVTESAEYA